MELTHRFTVPTPIEETWAHFNDIASVAECFPGAQVTTVEDDAFHGTVKVKLGPIALQYSGSGSFVEKDDAAHRFVVDAKGKDKRGNGTAGALVTLTMAPQGSATDVEVLTHLAITGKPAQFGRGVMQDVSDKLLGQFVGCLESRLGAPPAETTTAETTPMSTEVPTPASGPERAAPAVPPPAPPAAGSAATASEGTQAAGGPPPPRPAPPQQQDALDLGSTVLPVLAKTYWKPVLGVVVALVVLVWLATRLL